MSRWLTVLALAAAGLLVVLWRSATASPSLAPGDAAIEPPAAPRAAAREATGPEVEAAIARPTPRELAESMREAADPGDTQSWGKWLGDFFRPQPGEDLIAYRDRVLPVVQNAIAPQRQRVRRQLEDFAARAELDDETRGRIDEVLGGAQEALKSRILSGVMSGELFGPDVRPMNGVVFARDLLDVVVTADQDVRGLLDADDVTALDDSGFDAADYLLFATRWEDLLGVTE